MLASSASQPVTPNPNPLPSKGEGNKGIEPGPLRILKKFAYLLSARWVREALQAVFLIYLARVSSTTYGEFMLAIGLGSILLLVAEFGLNLPLVSLMSKKDGDPNAALSQVTILKASLLVLALLGVLGFMAWQNYSMPLRQVMFMLSAGVGLEALSNTFFVALQVQGRQDLQGKIAALAAGLGFGYGIIALILGAPAPVSWLTKRNSCSPKCRAMVRARTAWPCPMPWTP